MRQTATGAPFWGVSFGAWLAAPHKLTSAEIFDPVTKSLSRTAVQPSDRPCMALLPDGRVVLTGGSMLVSVFDPASNRWEDRAVLARPRSRCVAWALEDGGVLVAGGSDPDPLQSTEVISP